MSKPMAILLGVIIAIESVALGTILAKYQKAMRERNDAWNKLELCGQHPKNQFITYYDHTVFPPRYLGNEKFR